MKVMDFGKFDLKMPLVSAVIAALLMFVFSLMPFALSYQYFFVPLMAIGIIGLLAGWKNKPLQFIPFLVGVTIIWFFVNMLPIFNLTNLSGNDQVIGVGFITFIGTILGEYLNKSILKY